MAKTTKTTPEVKTPEYATILGEVEQLKEDDLFASFDALEVPETPEEGDYTVKITTVKPLKNNQLEVTVKGGEGIGFTYKWFADSLLQNLQKFKMLYRDEDWAQGSTSDLIRNMVGKKVNIRVTYNGIYTNYNLV